VTPPAAEERAVVQDCRRPAPRRYRRAVASRRLPLPAIIAATALALVAALGAFAVLDGGDAGGNDAAAPGDGTTDGFELSPRGQLPGSVAEVRLGSLRDGPDAALGELLTGAPVVVNFFASWCVPCVEEMPAIEAVHQSLGDQVTFVGLANQDADEDALATVEATRVTYPTFGDPDASALSYFGGLRMPTTVFIAADGTVVDVNSGALTEAQLRAKITDLFGIAA
jgi:cytochrome c biogenesis protein CcmG, thiol:disulfide interchange protein DsbE